MTTTYYPNNFQLPMLDELLAIEGIRDTTEFQDALHVAAKSSLEALQSQAKSRVVYVLCGSDTGIEMLQRVAAQYGMDCFECVKLHTEETMPVKILAGQQFMNLVGYF
ncbi:hypothetical protein [Vitreoscilla stercoraria]|uniref:Uncharacterized protein n=1 Tax=Vitreoscilla stercoraria TaxID=61 RepID=A0ABY4EDE3_VITST|nr:hypothetical protein [Vitreoscilla stercoraria]UOO93389.1 hypothetical protein LVJ81_05005 [Vitreoscilla stercoraria]